MIIYGLLFDRSLSRRQPLGVYMESATFSISVSAIKRIVFNLGLHYVNNDNVYTSEEEDNFIYELIGVIRHHYGDNWFDEFITEEDFS
jgi:signal recognition particle subunit SEC65